MLVHIVIIHRDRKLAQLCTALHSYHRRFTTLLRKYTGHCQFSKLQLGLKTKQALTPVNQGARNRQVHISGLDLLDDLILLTRILQLGLILKIESGFRVVADIHTHLIANGTCHIHDYFFIKSERGHTSELLANIGVILFAQVKSKDQLCRT